MPRSFMIAHRRFCEDDLISNSALCMERSRDVGDDMMHTDNHARLYTSYVPDSPELQKQRFTTERRSDKSVSASDGESDSGCSSQNDNRNELPLELEYSLGCPSGFSLLLELMTQSPRRYTSCDVFDVNISSDVANSIAQKLDKDDPQKVKSDFDFGQIKKFEVYPVTTNQVEKAENPNMHIHVCQEKGSSQKAIEPGMYVFEAANNRKGIKECTVYSNESDFPVFTNEDRSIVLGTSLGTAVSQTTPIYDYQIYSNQEQNVSYIQRRISFDEEMATAQKIRRFSSTDSQDEQPIDYSQLSSRRREKCREVTHEDRVTVGNEVSFVKEEPNLNAGKLSDDSFGAAAKLPAAGTLSKKMYEFILSPKMDGNGNLVLSQHPKLSNVPSLPGKVEENSGKGSEASHPEQYTFPVSGNYNRHPSYTQQGSPLSGTPASPVHCSPDRKQGIALEVSKAKFEIQENDNESAGNNKPQLPYHPKLKYLLAVSHYANAKEKQEEGQVTSSTSFSTSYQAPMIFSQDQTAQSLKNSKLNEKIYTKCEVGQTQHISSSELFHNLPKYHHRSSGTPNSTPTFKSSASSIEISKSSNSNDLDQHQISQSVRSSHLNSSSVIQVADTYINKHSSDHADCESSLEASSALYNQSNDAPMSPASLRDQQAAFSELLFSTNCKGGVDPYSCVDCAKRYSTSSNLARHRQTHRSVCDKKARKCPHCEKVYVSMPAYSMHVRTHNQGCECPHCGKKFSRPWLLQGHIRTHTGEKPFGCPQCGKSFADKSNLRAHIQTHSTEKPYVCGRCGKAFALKSYLYKHEESSCMRGQRFRH